MEIKNTNKQEEENNTDNNLKTTEITDTSLDHSSTKQISKKPNSTIVLIIVGVIVGVAVSNFFDFSNTNNTAEIKNIKEIRHCYTNDNTNDY